MNCCNDDGNCRQGRDCPVRQAKYSCDQLGVCQGLGADQCPHCDRPAHPTYPFAPGVIQGPGQPGGYLDDGEPWYPLTLRERITWFAIVMVFIAALAMLAGYLVERLA